MPQLSTGYQMMSCTLQIGGFTVKLSHVLQNGGRFMVYVHMFMTQMSVTSPQWCTILYLYSCASHSFDGHIENGGAYQVKTQH